MKIHYIKLDHLQICIPPGKEEEAKRFYFEKLGWTEIVKPESLKKNGGFWSLAGETEIHFGIEEESGARSKRHPAFWVSETMLVKEFLKGSGISIQEETPIPGVNRFSFYDPFGNRIEFLEREK
ncbi:glyoxalase [Metabacillus sp. GX 13764]|uniref:VOC family protein n=1 Tax=Metabacillus kandeliae TaxID=2900151 RepID=UPI001E50FA81|nr:VOC family protein [Metabacillus kandeliae]MCD7035474.1 glyoxalase [Metabacillus kandeliae]